MPPNLRLAANGSASNRRGLASAAPGAAANLPAEADTTTDKDNLIAGRRVARLGNVSTPTLTLYTPKGNNTGAAVVVFPGGGYQILAIDLEGTEVCDWLNSAGVTCVLLKYRVPSTGPYPKSPPRFRTRSAPWESSVPMPSSGTSTQTAWEF